MGGLIDTAVSGLKLSQLSLNTAGQNIVNANTEGYSRQSVHAQTLPSQFAGVGYVGSGVTVSQITRNTEQYLIDQVSSDLSVLGEFEQYLNNIGQLDNLLADPSTSVAASISDFFDALNEAAFNPASIENRQLLLDRTELLLNRFSQTETKIQNQNASLNSQMGSLARNVTSLGREIAQLNDSITSSPGVSDGIYPNDLLDRRDMLVRDLASIVDVRTTVDANLSMSVFIGEGQNLVIGPQSSELAAVPGQFNPASAELAFIFNGEPQYVTEQVSGGEIGGVLRYREEALDPALNSLGRIVLAFTDAINQQQTLGVDMEGNLGGALFTDKNQQSLASGRVVGYLNNPLPLDRVLSVDIESIDELTASDYRIVFPGPGQRYSMVRLEDNAIVAQGILNSKLPDEVAVDGLRVNFTAGSFQEGDSYLVQPTRNGVSQLKLLTQRAEAFAFATPVSAEAGIGNQGGAYVSQVDVTDVKNASFTTAPGALSPPLLVRFHSSTKYDVLDYSDPANPVSLVPPLNNRNFVPGAINTLLPSDPHGTTLSTAMGVAGVAQMGVNSNGYLEEVITISRRDPVTGFVTETNLRTESGQSAATIAQLLSSVDGVSASALSQLELSEFTSDGTGVPLNILLNGVDLTAPELAQGRTLTDPPSADFLRDSINLSVELKQQGIVASSNGLALTIMSYSGEDLVVDVQGNGGDSVRLRDGDLKSVVGRNSILAGYTVSPNTSFTVDLGAGPMPVPLSPGSFSSSLVRSTLQADVDRALGDGVLEVSITDNQQIQLVSSGSNKKLSITNVSGDDPFGLQPHIVTGPDLGEQPATAVGLASTVDPFDFSVTNGSFDLTINGLYSGTITLNQNFPVDSGNAIASAINTQIAASNGASGLAGLVQAQVNNAGQIELMSTGVGPDESLIISAVTDMQNLIVADFAYGTQLAGTQASVSGAVAVTGGIDFDQSGPHEFALAIDGQPSVQVSLTGTTQRPAIFTNTTDVSAGVDFSGVPNNFELTVTGYPVATIDLSGVDTSLAPDPFSSVPQGLADLMQERIDSQLGAGVVSVDVDATNNLTLSTVAAGIGTSLTVSNPTGNVATAVFPVVGTAVGSDQGAAGAVNIIRTAVNNALGAAGLDPVQVSLDASGFLAIASTTYGNASQVAISNVVGAHGIVFPGIDSGQPSTNRFVVGGSLDVQLDGTASLRSNRPNGLFGSATEGVANYTGYQVYLSSGQIGSGVPAEGDTFIVRYNGDSPGDNSNAMAMLGLQDRRLLGNGTSTLIGSYGELVEEVGILTSQARLSVDAGESLLTQSETALQSISGVNIDEEASNLIKFEQHYSASARLISIARDLFNTILDL